MTTHIDSNAAVVSTPAADAPAANTAIENKAADTAPGTAFVPTASDANGDGVPDIFVKSVALARYFTKEVAPSVTLLIASFSPIVLAVVAFRTEIAGLFGA